jgi:hypothetical protein
MINSIHPMNLDLYGLSLSPPQSAIVPNGSSESPPLSLTDHPTTTTTSDMISLSTSHDSSLVKHQAPPVIYPWMRKVHINNPGTTSSSFLILLSLPLNIF